MSNTHYVLTPSEVVHIVQGDDSGWEIIQSLANGTIRPPELEPEAPISMDVLATRFRWKSVGRRRTWRSATLYSDENCSCEVTVWTDGITPEPECIMRFAQPNGNEPLGEGDRILMALTAHIFNLSVFAVRVTPNIVAEKHTLRSLQPTWDRILGCMKELIPMLANRIPTAEIRAQLPAFRRIQL